MQPGSRRRQLDRTLRAAYSEGLLSESTFLTRLDSVLSEVTVNPRPLIGDLTLGATRGALATSRRLSARIRLWIGREPVCLLALDWSAPVQERLLIGRAPEADIVLDDATVSRRHAELVWRSGAWIVHDFGSRNGTLLNGRPVRRAQLRPGDYVSFAGETLCID